MCSTCCVATGSPIEIETAPIGGAGYDAAKHPLPGRNARARAGRGRRADGGGRRTALRHAAARAAAGAGHPRDPQGASLFANLRPALLYPELAASSTLKPEVVAGLDIMIVRELTGDIYFGEPRGRRTNAAGEREGFDTMRYSVPEIERIARVGFETAQQAREKALLGRQGQRARHLDPVARGRHSGRGQDYPDVALSHMYVDNAAMQLVRNPKQFDVIVTGNLFGDILSDEASMLAGSIGMLPSASLDANGKGLYEPIHGSAPDIAGQDKANPLATILSLAMMFRYTFARADVAERIERAVRAVLRQGLRTADIAAPGEQAVGTRAMGDAVVAALHQQRVIRDTIAVMRAIRSAGIGISTLPLRVLAAVAGTRAAVRGRATKITTIKTT